MKIRLGRFSRYYQDNPIKKAKEAEEANGAGHQPWSGPKRDAWVGTSVSNTYYNDPWQALWIPTTEYVTIPNVREIKRDKKLEGLIGGIGTATVEIENILYPEKAGGYHQRERGAMAPLRGYLAAGPPALATLAKTWLEELEAGGEPFSATEWKGRFAFAAQITVWEGYGSEPPKVFTGLIEDVDATSKPDRLVLTCRDFGQLFTESHFFGWGKDPVIDTPVVFVDKQQAATKQDVGYNAEASSQDEAHPAKEVLDFNEATNWQSATVGSAETTEYVDIHLNEGVYTFAEIAVLWSGMQAYLSLHPTTLTGGGAPTRRPPGGPTQPITEANKWLDKNGWVDLTKAEGQLLGGNSYLRKWETYPLGQQRPDLDEAESAYRVGKGSVLRISFRKLHKVEAGEHFRAGVKEFHGLYEKTEEGVGKAQWVTTEDIADVIRILCQWAGFKEWDIPDTGTRLPQRIVAAQAETYADVIKRICDGIGFTFFMADPTEFAGAHGEGSLGVPTFRKSRLLAEDTEAEKIKREEGIERNGPNIELGSRGSKRAGLPNPTVTDREMLTAINLKQTNEPLSYVIRCYGYTLSLPGNPLAGIERGKRVVYTFRPPWTGTPPYYANSRLGGILKQIVHHDALFATVDLCREAAWFIALMQAVESAEATIEVPAIAGLDLDDHVLLMDLGTGIATRLAVRGRSSTFVDDEKRKYVMTLTGVLLDSPDVRDMVKIINGEAEANGAGGQWSDPKTGTGSSLGYA